MTAGGADRPIRDSDPARLVGLAASLVNVASVSRNERVLADQIEDRLRATSALEVIRIGDNVIARTQLGRPSRVVLGGHLDTVPPNGNEQARFVDGILWGLGSADMKAGVAVMCDLADWMASDAAALAALAVDVTWVFYAKEEIARSESGLLEIEAEDGSLLEGDLAILGEPTGGLIEAGCQGVVRAEIEIIGARAHTARAWMGANAIHRAASLLTALERFVADQPIVEGLEFHEALQAVAIDGGVAGNVVPDRVTISLAHRFAPNRTAAQASTWLTDWCRNHLGPDDRVTITEQAPAAAPGLDNPLVAAMIAHHGLSVRSKLGWTDVAFFAERGVPAINFGPGDPKVAHTAEEHVSARSIAEVHQVLVNLLLYGPGGGSETTSP